MPLLVSLSLLLLLQVDQFSRQVHKLERGLAPNNLVPKLREEVNRWQVRRNSRTNAHTDTRSALRDVLYENKQCVGGVDAMLQPYVVCVVCRKFLVRSATCATPCCVSATGRPLPTCWGTASTGRMANQSAYSSCSTCRCVLAARQHHYQPQPEADRSCWSVLSVDKWRCTSAPHFLVSALPALARATQCLLHLQVLDHKEAIAAISNEAVQVAALEEMLAQVADK